MVGHVVVLVPTICLVHVAVPWLAVRCERRVTRPSTGSQTRSCTDVNLCTHRRPRPGAKDRFVGAPFLSWHRIHPCLPAGAGTGRRQLWHLDRTICVIQGLHVRAVQLVPRMRCATLTIKRHIGLVDGLMHLGSRPLGRALNHLLRDSGVVRWRAGLVARRRGRGAAVSASKKDLSSGTVTRPVCPCSTPAWAARTGDCPC